jgi:hypothetical protein
MARQPGREYCCPAGAVCMAAFRRALDEGGHTVLQVSDIARQFLSNLWLR